MYYVGVPETRGSQYLICFDCNRGYGFERVVELADDSAQSKVFLVDSLPDYTY